MIEIRAFREGRVMTVADSTEDLITAGDLPAVLDADVALEDLEAAATLSEEDAAE